MSTASVSRLMQPWKAVWLRKSDFEPDDQSECLSDTEKEGSIVEVEMAQQR